MENDRLIKALSVPEGLVDVLLDTDAYNEIDDQFALAYLLGMPERANIKGITAAPFFAPGMNGKSVSPADGMEKSYNEIHKVLTLADHKELFGDTCKGSAAFLPDEHTPVSSAAASFTAELSASYTEENRLYIIAIGAITNVASALLLRPEMKDSTVIVWLGGHARHMPDTREFNMFQDIAAARVVLGCGVPVVQIPCSGVADRFLTTRFELEHWLLGKNAICDYLVKNTVEEAESYAGGRPWSRVIWDVTAVSWLVNNNNRFLGSRLLPSLLPGYDFRYSEKPEEHLIRYVDHVNRDLLFEDLVRRITAL